jgi:small subunit ribosomal protein S17
MSEDEKKDAVEETAQDEGDAAAGPDAASGGSAGGGDASVLDPPESAPPADEESEPEQPQDDASADEPSSDAGGEASAEPSEEDQLPWKEKRRLQRSRRPHKAQPQRTAEERVAERAAVRKRKAEERRKERAAAKKDRTKGTGTPVAEKDSNAAKVRQGIVVSDKGQKSITVRVDIVRRHPTYEKVIRRSRTLHAHDERNEAGEGDTVRIVESRPLSKTKRWRLVEVLEKAK